jgi:hypothetical protein
VDALRDVTGQFVGGDRTTPWLAGCADFEGLGRWAGDLGRGLGLAARRDLGARGADRTGIGEQQAGQKDGGQGAPA